MPPLAVERVGDVCCGLSCREARGRCVDGGCRLHRRIGCAKFLIVAPEVVTPDSQLRPADVFERPIASDYECGDLEGYNKCEWGVIKRAADGWILGRRESVATMAIIVRGDSNYDRLDDLADVPISIQHQNRLPLHDLQDAGGPLRQGPGPVAPRRRTHHPHPHVAERRGRGGE